MQITQHIFHLGPFIVTSFSMVVILSVVMGGVVTGWMAHRRGENAMLVFDLTGWMLFLGIVFARLFYILNPPPSVTKLYSRDWYLSHPFDLQVGPLAVWSGGLGQAGMLVGAVLGALLVFRRCELDGWLWAELIIPGLLLMLVIAPWGNLLVGQMIGPPTSLPWGIVIANPPPPYGDVPAGTHFHPTPVYLSIWAALILVGVGGLRKLLSAHLQKGDILLGVSLLYAVGLFLADFVRVDVNRMLGLSGMQFLALIIVLWAVSMIGRRYHDRARPDLDTREVVSTGA
ncbi:MAG: prolipoprotein diacylglyceryl transferase [Anaerolineae bacterium]|nr:prolipoprotein diacylglyceryl transferase [Anaerolineae bacterium]